LATEWLAEDLTVTQAARKIQEASKAGDLEFRRLDDDANIVVFSILADSSTFCGNVRIQDTAIARRQRLKITVSEDASKAPPKPGGLGGLFAKKAKYAARPEVIQKAVASLKAILPPV
jgi:hypothetical protein